MLPRNYIKDYSLAHDKNYIAKDLGVDIYVCDDTNTKIEIIVQCKYRNGYSITIDDINKFSRTFSKFNKVEKILFINEKCNIPNEVEIECENLNIQIEIIPDNDLNNYAISERNRIDNIKIPKIETIKLNMIKNENEIEIEIENLLIDDSEEDEKIKIENLLIDNSENDKKFNNNDNEEIEIQNIPDFGEFKILSSTYRYNENYEIELTESKLNEIQNILKNRIIKHNVKKHFIQIVQPSDKSNFPQIKQIKLNEYRPIQNEIFDKITLQPFQNWEINAACGTGKTISFKRLISYFIENSTFDEYLILVPQISLAEQTVQVFNNEYLIKNEIKNKSILPSIYTNTFYTNSDFIHENNNSNVSICVYNSINRFIEYFENKFEQKGIDSPKLLIIIDEAHHILNSESKSEIDENDYNNYISLINNFMLNHIHYSFSATLINTNNEYRINYPLPKAINDGILTNYEIIISPTKTDNNDLKTIRGARLNNLVHYILPNQDLKHILIYVNRISFAVYLSSVLNQCSTKKYEPKHDKYINSTEDIELPIDYPKIDSSSNYIISSDSKSIREKIFEKFENNEFRIIVSVNCISEGINLPFVDTVIFFDDRKSDISIIQCCGRALRQYTKKINQNETKTLESKNQNFNQNENENKSMPELIKHFNQNELKLNETKTLKFKKSKGHIVIFKDILETTKSNYIYNLLNEFDYDFNKRKLINSSNSSNEISKEIDFKYLTEKSENNIQILKGLTDDDYKNILEDFKNENKRIPNDDEIFYSERYKLEIRIGTLFNDFIVNNKYSSNQDKIEFIKNLFNLTNEDIEILNNYILTDVNDEYRNELMNSFYNSLNKQLFDKIKKNNIIINRVLFTKDEFVKSNFNCREGFSNRQIRILYIDKFKRKPRFKDGEVEYFMYNSKCYSLDKIMNWD